jgi:hypothetical protein
MQHLLRKAGYRLKDQITKAIFRVQSYILQDKNGYIGPDLNADDDSSHNSDIPKL